jgi:hypothetical protein
MNRKQCMDIPELRDHVLRAERECITGIVRPPRYYATTFAKHLDYEFAGRLTPILVKMPVPQPAMKGAA